jgi:hypothetical protein
MQIVKTWDIPIEAARPPISSNIKLCHWKVQVQRIFLPFTWKLFKLEGWRVSFKIKVIPAKCIEFGELFAFNFQTVETWNIEIEVARWH